MCNLYFFCFVFVHLNTQLQVQKVLHKVYCLSYKSSTLKSRWAYFLSINACFVDLLWVWLMTCSDPWSMPWLNQQVTLVKVLLKVLLDHVCIHSDMVWHNGHVLRSHWSCITFLPIGGSHEFWPARSSSSWQKTFLLLLHLPFFLIFNLKLQGGVGLLSSTKSALMSLKKYATLSKHPHFNHRSVNVASLLSTTVIRRRWMEAAELRRNFQAWFRSIKPYWLAACLPAQSLPGRCQSNLSPRSKVACEFSVASAEFKCSAWLSGGELSLSHAALIKSLLSTNSTSLTHLWPPAVGIPWSAMNNILFSTLQRLSVRNTSERHKFNSKSRFCETKS